MSLGRKGAQVTPARRALDEMRAAIDAHDLDAVTRALSPGCVFVTPEGVAEGREEVASYLAQFLGSFPDYHILVWRKIDMGDCAVDEFSGTGTHTRPMLLPSGEVLEPTGRKILLRGCSVCTSDENGLIASCQLYFDQLEMLTQLGLTPPLPG